MRCSNTQCGAEGKTNFCPKCGSKMVDENIDIVTCTSCKERLTPNHNFCPNCGAKVDRICKKCKTELKPEHKFCTNCGEPGMQIESQPAGIADEKIEKKDNGIDLQSESGANAYTLNNFQKEKTISIKSNIQDLQKGDLSQDIDNSGGSGNSANKEQQHIKVYGSLQKRDTERKTSGYSMIMYLRKTINKNETEKSMIVRFHALISEEFKFDPSKHKLVFVLENDSQEEERECNFKRKWRDNVYEMEYDLKIDAEHSKGRVLQYRYKISKPDKQECEWECLQDAYNNDIMVRTVVVQYTRKKFDIVEQYDGVIAKKSSWGKLEVLVKHWKNELIKRAKTAVQYFSKDIVMESKCLNKLDFLLSCSKKSYLIDRKCWDDNGEAFREQVGGIVLQTLADHSTEVSLNRNKAKEKRETLIVFALTALRLARQNLVPLGAIESWKKMCKCLIMTPDEQKRKCIELDIMDKLFPSERDSLKDAFVLLARSIATESSSPSWLFLMPWIHFLYRMNSPYDEPSFDPRHDSEDAAWWGIPSLKDAVMKFKDRPGEWDMPVGETVKILQPLFEMDFYLPRTFMASLNLKKLTTEIGKNLIGTEIQLAVLIYYIRTTRSGHSISRLTQDEQLVIDCMNCVLISLQQKSDKRNHSTIAQNQMSFRFSTQLFEASTQTQRSQILSLALHIVLHSLSDYERKGDGTIQNDVLSVLDECFRMLCNWMDTHYQSWTNGLENTLAMWNDLYEDSESVSQTVCNEWNKLISISVTDRLENQVRRDKRNMEKYVEVYCQKLDTFKAPAQTVLSIIAFQAIEMGYSVDYQTMSTKEIKRLGGLLSKLFLEEWDKNFKTLNTQHDILQDFLSWPPFIQFLKIYAKKDENCGLLVFSETCQERLIQVISLVQQCTEELVTGEILLATLDLIASKNVNFPEMAELVQLDPNYGKDFISKAIKIRCLEIKAFREQADMFAVFLSLTQKFKNVNKQAITDTLEKQGSIKSNRVAEFCHPVDVSQVKDIDTFRPTVCAFEVPEHVVAELTDLKRCSNSIVFKHLWTQECKKVANKCSTIDDVVIKVWKPVKERWDAKMLQIRSGHTTFVEFEAIIGKLHGEKYDDMFDDLQAMNVEVKQIKLYIQQLTKYRQLKVCKEAARAICKLADIYRLQGDFGKIRKIAEHEDKDIEIGLFDSRILEKCSDLTDINKERIDCLNAFSSCEPLVRWLRKSMQGTGLKELKVFVDLALISAGDEPMSIALVHYLNSAVKGYNQLIFEMEETAGYTDLLLHFSVVWKELEADPALSQKLVDSNRYLDLFKDIKKVHVSVEVTSLMQAEAINEGGLYIIGKSVWKDARRDKKACEEELVLSDVLLLILTKKNTNQMTEYSLAQLQDLQSRLMLVAGQGYKTMESVELYTSVFDSLARLGNVYIKLLSSGCLLFKDLSITFRCNKKQHVCVQLEFGEGRESPILKGRRSQDEGLKEMIPNVAQFMEHCLEEWLQHFKEKRKRFFHLNFYTVDQLVILQRELIKIGVDEPAHYVYPLLSAVKEHTSRDDLSIAMGEAKKEITEKKQLMLHKEKADSVAALDDDQLNEKIQNFIAHVKAAGFSNALALKALKHVCPDDPTEGLAWCIENEDKQHEDESTTFSNLTDIMQQMDLTGWSESETDMQTLIERQIQGIQDHSSVGSAPLIRELELLWKMFLESITSNLRDYLSLDDLGLILKYLAAKNTSTIHRSVPTWLHEGKPNLIVCPSADILKMTLTVYIDQPLPMSDEVLLCTERTTKDEVDIFLRRALFYYGEKIYCLVHADLLEYDVSEAVEHCLEEHLLVTNADSKYRLVVICGSDNEYKSAICSSLDKFKRHAVSKDIYDLRNYLSNKLTIQEGCDDIKPAAYVDRDRSSVRVVKSWRAGVGKSLYKQRREREVSCLNQAPVRSDAVSISLQQKAVDLHYVLSKLLEYTNRPGETSARVIHIDLSYEVQIGVDYLLFNLLILGCLTDKTGYVWRKSSTDIFLIETIPLMTANPNTEDRTLQHYHTMLAVLPDLTCRSPIESLGIFHGNRPDDFKDIDQLFDEEQFKSLLFQRPFQYLIRLDEGRPLNDVNPESVEGTPKTCLITLLRHCGLEDPSWSELHHFVWFLNTQLVDFEQNSFVGAAAADLLPGFAKFVLLFLIHMSRDFSSRSLNLSEQSPKLNQERNICDETKEEGVSKMQMKNYIETYQMRRTWESSPHPYLFFNEHTKTFTFLGFNIDRASGDLIDLQTKAILEKRIMDRNLYDALISNGVNLRENFDALKRDEKLRKLCNVMGVECDPRAPAPDPDDTYELTTDNVKKMLAIYMRFRCDIPVIIMGETGCGKTRLVKFMCALQVPRDNSITNMVLMKVHGGTTDKDIIEKVKEAEELAKRNKNVYTVLFFDEANTTEAIGLIKEIMCDKRLKGEKLILCENLKMVAACNPYRKHSEKLIKKLEKAGLGYHVDADVTTDRFGHVPMRRLVYRVQPLPQSMLPMVWDFGQLNTQVEDLYIRQMVKRYIGENMWPDKRNLKEVVSAILTASQEFMRNQKDECSFVSLRDVDRVLTVTNWFYVQSQEQRTLYDMMDDKLRMWNMEQDDRVIETDHLDDLTRSLVLALGVCYHACLKKRAQYRECVSKFFENPCDLPGGADQIKLEIDCCQEVVLDNINLEDIARNMALKENVFMMVVCIELRIPLFLVGKPGSSKSLAKTIVSDAMQRNASRNRYYRELKQVEMVSFQCSPHSTADGIVGTFRQCAEFQRDKNLDAYVSVVVLDEVGLAEDSPKMPLKTLHPLLEDGCQGNENHERYKKVAFIGLSNWALDPAKMNRGILVKREVPDVTELQNTASGICQSSEEIGGFVEHMIEPMAQAYLEIFKQASEGIREFYGLRDFYSLVKMIYKFVKKSKRHPTWNEIQHAIRRNFGGLDLKVVDPETCFRKYLRFGVMFGTDEELDNSPAGLIRSCVFGKENESRYLLLLTENYGVLSIIQQKIFAHSQDIKPITIFGSSFRSDQEYTQVCRNINKIKVCMQTGNTVVLLNLENLYESLYDALNQNYVFFGGERYVDIGLGTHRVKCQVHRNFRLIVVAEKQTVYKKFPIPLINRLEKHFLTISTILTTDQEEIAHELNKWVKSFVNPIQTDYLKSKEKSKLSEGDVFIGYHDDTCSAVVLDVWDKCQDSENKKDKKAKVLEACKYELLWCATPESLFRLRYSNLPKQEQETLKTWYFEKQQHDSLIQFLQQELDGKNDRQLCAQITCHSKLMANVHKKEISKAIGIPTDNILLLETLSAFETEQKFTNKIRNHIKNTENGPSLMMIQCESGDINANLIACARYCVRDELQKIQNEGRAPLHVLFIIQIQRKAVFTGFQCGVWKSIHIDEIYTEDRNLLSLRDMQGKSVAGVFDYTVKKTETEQDSFGNKLRVKGLVLRCVAAALSMVKYRDEDTMQTTNRVSFLHTMLQEVQDQGKPLFIQGICCLLHKLLLEKETKTLIPSMAQNWMTEIASSNDKIHRAGTFRRACLQTLEGKVTPIIAGVIAYLDINDNMNILVDKQMKWKSKLWMALLCHTESHSLQYSDLQSPTRQNDLKELNVISTGYEGHYFSARMPFSWLLINKINEILELHHTRDDVDDTEVRVLCEDRMGHELATITDEQIIVDAADEYIQDLVHIIYNPATDQTEHQLVARFIHVAVNNRTRTCADGNSLLHRLVIVHQCYRTFANRLPYFRGINSIWSKCSAVITDLQTKKPDHYQNLFQDNDFTFAAIILLMEDLTPQNELLNQPGGQEQWLERVHRCRPLVEKIISLYAENQTRESSFKPEYVHKARTMWSHIVVMKLYFEHLCTATMSKTVIRTFCSFLWKDLQKADLKKSISEIETFLERYNQRVMKDNGFSGKCKECEQTLTVPPFTLPCNEIVCDLCAEEMMHQRKSKCVKCDVEFPDGWKPVRLSCNNRDALENVIESQKRCNTFFMDVVSQLCFSDNIAPSQEVIQKLLGYIFFTTRGQHQRTREFTIFNTGKGLDPNPVFRSFLLQLLARTSEEDMMENLKIYFEKAQEYMKPDADDQSHQYLELRALVIHCLEDMFALESTKIEKDEVAYATDALEKAEFTIADEQLLVENLYGIANARMGLAVLAKYLFKLANHNASDQAQPGFAEIINTSVTKLIQSAQQLFNKTGNVHIRSFLVKVLCKTYGVHTYHTICRMTIPELEWINFMEIGKVVEASDRYVICGEQYTSVRESLAKFLMGEDTASLDETVQELQETDVQFETMLHLAVFREVTCSNLYPENRRKHAPSCLTKLTEFINRSVVIKDKVMLQALIHNQLKPRQLMVQEGADHRFQGMQCLVVHFMTVMTRLEGEKSLLQPLVALMETPQECAGMFLPTMPQDDLDEIKAMFRAQETTAYGEKLVQIAMGREMIVFYRCPNGHPYAIGECGRAYTVAKCNVCGADIGGERHNLKEKNKKDADFVAIKQTGHILGRAEDRGEFAQAERQMTPATCAILRLFVHLSMYTSARKNVQDMQRIISPEIDIDQVENFLWAHILKDTEVIRQAIQRSEDDVLLLMHTLLIKMMNNHKVYQLPEEVYLLSTKRGRQIWEVEFFKRFLQESLQNLQDILQTANQLIATDQRLGLNVLQCILCETDTQNENEQQISKLWQYRIPISLVHLRQEAMSLPHDQYKLLQLFLQQEPFLRALRYVPSILRLQRALFRKYLGKLDKAEAAQITVGHLRRESEAAGDEIRQLINDFAEAWELGRHALTYYTCPTEFGMMVVSEELCHRSINDSTPILTLLPTTMEAGLCSYALLDFLFRKQNDFLDNYRNETNRKSSSISSVKPNDVTSADLISFSPEHDIKPLLLANCQYSFEIGKGTKIEYDFASLERQLMDRLFYSKSKIDIGPVLQIDLMVYRYEVTNADVFKKLNEKIEQEELGHVVKNQICSEIRSLPELCRSLDNLSIATTFISSTGGQSNRSLHVFMLETLQMETTIHSEKAQQVCKFKHIKSLWLLMSYQKSKLMFENGQDTEFIFESVPGEFHEDLPNELKEQVKEYAMKKISIEKLFHLLEVLHEYILLVVAVRQNANDEDYIDTTNHVLCEWLCSYKDDFDPAILADFPKDIRQKHSVYTWVYAYRHLREKQNSIAQN